HGRARSSSGWSRLSWSARCQGTGDRRHRGPPRIVLALTPGLPGQAEQAAPSSLLDEIPLVFPSQVEREIRVGVHLLVSFALVVPQSWARKGQETSEAITYLRGTGRRRPA